MITAEEARAFMKASRGVVPATDDVNIAIARAAAAGCNNVTIIMKHSPLAVPNLMVRGFTVEALAFSQDLVLIKVTWYDTPAD